VRRREPFDSHWVRSPNRTISPAMPATLSESMTAARRAASVLVDNKALDVRLLDLREVTDMTDFFIVASGTSDTHVRASAGHVIETLKKEGLTVFSVEGMETGRWVLLDYVDFVVHVFHPTLRSFYQLERLWGDAPAVAVTA
jgi:ribosome-associated protein